MSITTIHQNLPVVVSKSIIKSIIGSLNATCIAYTRGHLKFGAKQKPVDHIPTIDDHNDEIAAVNAAIERNRASGDMGFAVQMPTGELIERLMAIREFFVDQLMQHATMNDTPLTIAETVKFQMDRQPENKDAFIDALIAALGDDTGITKEMLVAANLKNTADDAADLRNNAAKIVDHLDQYAGVDFEFDDDAVNDNFAALPAHVQYKLMSAAIRAHDKAVQGAVVKLLRGNLDAGGDVKMLRANRGELIIWLTDFSKRHRNDLDAYVERGGMLMELEDRTIVTSNTKPVKEAEPQAEAKPKAKAKMRRAPAPSN
jgi:hypothetical protein